MSVLLPGQSLPSDVRVSRIGPGLHSTSAGKSSQEDAGTQQEITAIRAGVLYSSAKSSYLDSSVRRYIPAQNDSVIGQVVARYAEGYRVDIASAIPATLDALAFFNVNRKNKPNLQVGSLVYARISSQIAGMESELECLTPENKSGGYGPLDDGYVMKTVSLGLCRRLLSADDVILSVIGEKVEYEVVVGMNGRIWINSEERKTTIIISQILQQVEFMTEGEVRDLISQKLKDI